MRTKNSPRYKIIRGAVLAGSILSFIPAFALVRSNAAADIASTLSTPSQAAQTQPSTTNQPSNRQPSAQSQTPSQTLPKTTQQVRPRIRTRAS